MQVYRGLDVATSKPGIAERRRVPHHGIDLVEPGEDFSAGDFVRYAEPVVERIRRRGKLPVLVGGTGLYLRALLKGIVEAPRRDEALRARLRAIGERRGAGFVHRMLRRVDPAAAEPLRPRDRQRIVRALEVFFSGPRSLSERIRSAPFGPDRYRVLKVGLNMDRAALYRRIDERVVRFFAAGLLDEVRGLLARGVPGAANAFKAIGYREALACLDGAIDGGQAVALAQRGTRRYAKRQWTWFRREEGIIWFDLDPERPDRFERPLAHIGASLGHP
jgi:tRNA dimethylallyltransferase